MSTSLEEKGVRWDDQRRIWIVKETADYEVCVIPMIFNDRVTVGPAGASSYDHGWCYDKGGTAFLAALVWDPAAEAKPAGWKKQATPGERTLP